MGPRRRALRIATAALHRRLDHQLGSLSDRAAYARYLRIMTAFRGSVESEFQRRFGGCKLQPQSIWPELCMDCCDLQLGVPQSGDALELRDQTEDYLGAFYVLEGSSLGAAVLWKRAHALGLNAEFGARHLALQTSDRANWPAFQRHLEACEDVNVDALNIAAEKVFAFALRVAEDVENVDQG